MRYPSVRWGEVLRRSRDAESKLREQVNGNRGRLQVALPVTTPGWFLFAILVPTSGCWDDAPVVVDVGGRPRGGGDVVRATADAFETTVSAGSSVPAGTLPEAPPGTDAVHAACEQDVGMWSRRDKWARALKTTGKGGPAWASVYRRETLDTKTSEWLLSEEVGHSAPQTGMR